MSVPAHLKPYIAKQNPKLYTAIDHACWRYIMRVSKAFFKEHAHRKYLQGLVATGVTTERIPLISEMDRKLKKFGWRAAGVIGFIPPAIFLEFQAQGILPIGCDMRNLEHLAYTPAPDIVHEAAGHAPIIADREYGRYLKRYGEAARNAIFSDEDLKVYEAIRRLSDIKENPKTSDAEIKCAEEEVEKLTASLSFTSEATQLSRFAWWTIEYGLVGSLKNPKIYGAGLLSSVGESYDALTKTSAKFVPLTLECIYTNYDITKPQPQLFVTPDFKHLSKVLGAFVDTMAFKRGGSYGLSLAKQAKTVTTVVYDSGLQVSGILRGVLSGSDEKVIYLQFQGPTQLAYADRELPGQGPKRHQDGFGSPLGRLKGIRKSAAELSRRDLQALGLSPGKSVLLAFDSGLRVQGVLKKILRRREKNLLMTFTQCTVSLGERVLFAPEWGEYDMACGENISSVFGGAADRAKYLRYTGEIKGVVIQPKSNLTAENRKLNAHYLLVRRLREKPLSRSTTGKRCGEIFLDLQQHHPTDWLLRLELLELAERCKLKDSWVSENLRVLREMARNHADQRDLIERGLTLLHF